MRRDALARRREPEPLTHVPADVAPHHGDLVALGHHVLDRELRVEGRADHADALLQALDSLRLSGERVMLDMVGPRDLVKDLEPALVSRLLVQPPNRSLVLAIVRHLDSSWTEPTAPVRAACVSWDHLCRRAWAP